MDKIKENRFPILDFHQFLRNFLKSLTYLFVISAVTACLGGCATDTTPSDGENITFLIAQPLNYFFGKNFALRDHVPRENIWLPISLVNQDRLVLQESDFYLGSYNDAGTFITPPQKGFCKILNTNYLNHQKLFLFHASLEPEFPKNNILFILSPHHVHPVAVARLNQFGNLTCYLPTEHYIISAGYGYQRQGIPFGMENHTIQLPLRQKSDLDIMPDPSRNLWIGDTIRIGRQEENFSDTGEKEQIITSSSWDLYTQANALSQKMGVDEFLNPSILVNQKHLRIALDRGKYTVAVLRKNRLVCLAKENLYHTRRWILKCPPQDESWHAGADKIPPNKRILSFDPNLVNQGFASYRLFQRWLFSTGNEGILQAVDGDRYRLFLQDRSKKTVMLPAQKIPEKLLKKIHHDAPPEIQRSIVPYATYYEALVPKSEILTSAPQVESVVKKNGANVSFIQFTGSFSQKNRTQSEQTVRFYVFVPPWNPTNRLEMRLNGTLYKRWMIAQDQSSQFFTRTFKTSVSKEKKQKIQVVATGSQERPDFLYGTDKLQPYSESLPLESRGSKSIDLSKVSSSR